MSVIDQAFVKAYSRRTQVSSTGEPAQQDTDVIASPPDVSINPKSDQSAIVWVDAVADQYLRRDEPHKLTQPQSRSRTGSPTPNGQGPSVDGRARGSRPTSHPAANPSPSTTSPAASGGSRPAPHTRVDSDTRVDAGHVVSAPASATSGTGAPADSARQASHFNSSGEAVCDMLQFATLPWIEASSTLIDTPLNQSVTGPYYSDSVIVQENYLPAAVTPSSPPPTSPTAPSLPTAPLATLSAVVTPEPQSSVVADSVQEPVAKTASPKPGVPSPDTSAPKKTFTPPAVPPFAAVWEVDEFEFSDTVIALFGEASLIKAIGFPLDRAVSEGLQTLLITSIEHGAGRTTVATGIAIAAAAAGLRVAIVDATMATASARASTDGSSLADALNLDIQFGWIEAIRSGISIAETAIHSIEDQLTVLPLVLPMAGLPPTSDEFGRVIQTLRQAFDLIVIDGPPCTEAAFRPLVSHPSGTAAVDAAILVQDMRDASADQANRVMETLRRDGITGLGMVQNFV